MELEGWCLCAIGYTQDAGLPQRSWQLEKPGISGNLLPSKNLHACGLVMGVLRAHKPDPSTNPRRWAPGWGPARTLPHLSPC